MCIYVLQKCRKIRGVQPPEPNSALQCFKSVVKSFPDYMSPINGGTKPPQQPRSDALASLPRLVYICVYM